MAQDSYHKRGDYSSLTVIAKHLRIGMTRNEVHALLGEPKSDFFVREIYASDRDEYSIDAGGMVREVLRVEYGMKGVEPTQRVTGWDFILIGE